MLKTKERKGYHSVLFAQHTTETDQFSVWQKPLDSTTTDTERNNTGRTPHNKRLKQNMHTITRP